MGQRDEWKERWRMREEEEGMSEVVIARERKGEGGRGREGGMNGGRM